MQPPEKAKPIRGLNPNITVPKQLVMCLYTFQSPGNSTALPHDLFPTLRGDFPSWFRLSTQQVRPLSVQRPVIAQSLSRVKDIAAALTRLTLGCPAQFLTLNTRGSRSFLMACCSILVISSPEPGSDFQGHYIRTDGEAQGWGTEIQTRRPGSYPGDV